jgi:hypothetical protein
MTHMLSLLEIPLIGKHHSGIDDAKNISAVIIELLKKDFIFN